MRFSSTMGRRLMAVSTALLALQGANAAWAQFVPYGAPNQGYAQQQPVPQYQQQPYQQVPNQQYPTTPQYTAMAFLGADPAAAAPAETVVPGPMQNGVYAQGPVGNSRTAPAVNYSQPAPAPSYDSYGASYAGGNCGAYNTFDRGRGYGNMGGAGGCYTGQRGCGRQWFGGYYGLYMGREGNNWVPLAFSTSTANAPPYYPTDTEFVINLRDLDNDFQGGAEVRLGFTFGGGNTCDPCGRSCGCSARYAVEGGYWGLVEDEQSVIVTDLTTDANRLYGMIDFRGWEADMGAGFRPLNHYFDYGPPTEDYTNGGALDDIEVRSFTARSNFSVQSLEFNLMRLPTISGGGCGGCDSGCSGYGGGRAAGGCGGQRYSLTTLLGARYFRIDDDFYFRSDWENVTTPATGFAAYNVQADNHLVGLQLGCNGIYRVGCSGRWALHCSSNAGVYGNHMEVDQWVDVPVGGTAQFANGANGAASVNGEDDAVAFIGEIRVGSSYQYSDNWRLYSGYRAMGISGVALSFDQVPTFFGTPNQVGYVASTGSIFLHGLQAGVECTY